MCFSRNNLRSFSICLSGVYRKGLQLLISVLLWGAITSWQHAHADGTAQNPVRMLELTVGEVDAFDPNGNAWVGISYRFLPFGRMGLFPALGVSGSDNGSLYVHADLRHDFWLNDRWIFVPSFGVGAFKSSDSLRLGHGLEFRSGFDLACRIYGQYRLAVGIHHLSNAGLGDKNPGTETVVATFGFPLGE